MKRLSISLGALVLIATIPFVGSTPVMASLQQAGQTIAQAVRRPQVRLNLSAEKQVVRVDAKGQRQISWEALSGSAVVHPSDVLRYTIRGANAGNEAARNLVFTQPIPQQTTYVLESATSASGAGLTYSIDNGKTFVEKPMIKVTLPNGRIEERPAPAEAYTHVRWNFREAVNPAAAINASYQVRVR
ncbi:DUF11 domain-containing protein [Leptolyngbya sp. FACHB-261]|uniref:DUF11 domain-containing protein n=1 Tax=Leptolyngbya sp. FACHB-261 TaxID=2692806 RepID=UPI001687842A|nr:DUF11 domain-containing protein [Leptolyngbya sp. FACHB-261]MBD2101036.1 DUF11 domain-containing protein [Leptolyngbya sp. FACHB-261]